MTSTEIVGLCLIKTFIDRARVLCTLACCVTASLFFVGLTLGDEPEGDGGVAVEESSQAAPVGGSWKLEQKLNLGESSRQFRVDNVVRIARNEREVSFKSSTIFYEDYVFDFVGDNGEIVVYSFDDRKFALIDPIRRMRSELDLDEIDRFLSRVRPILRERNDKFVNFMLDPAFDVSYKEDELFFQSKFIDYHIETNVFESEDLADAYFNFINALGKLNVYMNPGAVTPLARLEANKKLADESRFPTKIVTDVYPKGKTIFTKTIHIVNESTLARRLSERDRNRLNRTAHFFAQFPLVNFQTYFEKTSNRQ